MASDINLQITLDTSIGEVLAILKAELAYKTQQRENCLRRIAKLDQQLKELNGGRLTEIRSATSEHPARTIVMRT